MQMFTMLDKHLLTRATVAKAARALGDLLLRNGDNVDRDGIEAHALQQVLGLLVHIQLSAFRILGEIKSRDLGDVLILAFTLLFL